MAEPKLIILNDAQELYVRAAEEVAHITGEAICTHGEFTFCLSGGSTPAATYDLLATRFRLSVDWKEVQFFWGDERCVPPDNAESNYAMANRTMLSKLALRPDQVHRMRGEDPPPAAATAYEDELRKRFGSPTANFPASISSCSGWATIVTRLRCFPAIPRFTKRSAWSSPSRLVPSRPNASASRRR